MAAGAGDVLALSVHGPRGVVDLGAIVFFLSLTGLFLYLTHKVVESRRWK